MSFASFYEGYDDEKRGGRSVIMKGNGTMSDLTPKAHKNNATSQA